VPQEVRGDSGGDLSGNWANGDGEAFADRMEEQVERVAPGFRELIIERDIQTPLDLERENRNLVGGAINGGTAQLQQQAIFRPIAGLGRADTPVRGRATPLPTRETTGRDGWRRAT